MKVLVVAVIMMVCTNAYAFDPMSFVVGRATVDQEDGCSCYQQGELEKRINACNEALLNLSNRFNICTKAGKL